MAADLRAEGHSVRAIAGALGVGKSTIQEDLAELSAAGQLSAPERVTGTDGKSRPASNRPAKAKKERPPKPPKEPKPKVIIAERKFEKLYEEVKAELVAERESKQDLAETARDLQDKLTAFETTEPDEQQKEIQRLQKRIVRLEAEVQRLTVARNDCQNKNNELIRQVKLLQRKQGGK